MDSLYLAWRYLSFNKTRTLILIASITLITFLPLALKILLSESEKQLTARADNTPLVIGAKGSALDLVMSNLYFAGEMPGTIPAKAQQAIWESQLALPIPIYNRFTARGYPVIGTTLDYFNFRRLTIQKGRLLATLGECVIGADVAENLGISTGDSLITSPENPFDLGGIYPLKMHIVGILARTGNEDDKAVFVDLKTTWVIAGLGHGHDTDVENDNDTVISSEQAGSNIIFNAKLRQFSEITKKNIHSFHFHGNQSDYPLTGIIAVPVDTRAGTLLQGRYISEESQYQIVKPETIIQTLLDNIFRIKKLLDAILLLVSLATVLSIILVFSLSLRLREKEINTIYMLGCNRITVLKLVAAEILIIIAASMAFCTFMLYCSHYYSRDLVKMLLVN